MISVDGHDRIRMIMMESRKWVLLPFELFNTYIPQVSF